MLLVGPNGAGKRSLVGAVLGPAGDMPRGGRAQIAYLLDPPGLSLAEGAGA